MTDEHRRLLQATPSQQQQANAAGALEDVDLDTESVEEAVSIDDEMHEIYAELNQDDSPGADDDSTAADGPPPADAADSAPQRGPDGKFLPKDSASAPGQPAAAAPTTAAATSQDMPPESLRPQIKAMWKNLAPEVKAEFHKREQDFFKGIAQYQGKAQVADTLWQSIAPYKPIMDQFGADVPTALNEVLRTAAVFYVGTPAQKAAALQQLAQVHGIQLASSAGNTGQKSPLDPVMEKINREFARINGVLSSQQAQAQNSEVQKAWGEIVAFRSNPENKYFKDVSVLMGQLMNAGVVGPTDLKGAYERACQLTPAVKLAIESEASAANAVKTSLARGQKVAAARRAGNLGIRSQPAPLPAVKPGSMEETMHEVYRGIATRG